MAAQGEEAWYVARTKLHQLLQTQPQYTNEQYATACQMSLSWVKRWKKLLKAHPNPTEKEVATLLQGKPSTPKTKPKPLDPFWSSVSSTTANNKLIYLIARPAPAP